MTGAYRTVPRQLSAGFKVVVNATRAGRVLFVSAVNVGPQYPFGVTAAGDIIENGVFLPSRRAA